MHCLLAHSAVKGKKNDVNIKTLAMALQDHIKYMVDL